MVFVDEHVPHRIGCATSAFCTSKSCYQISSFLGGNQKLASRTKYGTLSRMDADMPLEVVFYRTESGNEPVRDWLQGLSKQDKKSIGGDIKTVQYGWPIGMPVVRKMDPGLWEIRCRLDQRIARILFTVRGERMILLHGFIKKSQKTPQADLRLVKDRKANLEK